MYVIIKIMNIKRHARNETNVYKLISLDTYINKINYVEKRNVDENDIKSFIQDSNLQLCGHNSVVFTSRQ
jgi:hypothetical protein